MTHTHTPPTLLLTHALSLFHSFVIISVSVLSLSLSPCLPSSLDLVLRYLIIPYPKRSQAQFALVKPFISLVGYATACGAIPRPRCKVLFDQSPLPTLRGHVSTPSIG